MYKMLFNTGVRPENRVDKLIAFSEHEEWKGGTLHIAFYLEKEPPENWTLKHLCNNPREGELSIPIVAGGMLSKFAIFTCYEG